MWRTGSGVTVKSTKRDDRRIVRQALMDSTAVRSTIQSNVGVPIALQIISRCLTEAILQSDCPFRLLPLTPKNQSLRIRPCQARTMWNATDWQNLMLSDESWFVLATNENHGCGWRWHGERNKSTIAVVQHTVRTAGIMVWGGDNL